MAHGPLILTDDTNPETPSADTANKSRKNKTLFLVSFWSFTFSFYII